MIVMHTHDPSDGHLVGRIVNGDGEALHPLMERYERPLLAMLRRAVGNREEAEDLFQETWIRVVRSAHRFDPTYPFGNWLFRISWNLVRDHMTRRERMSTDDLEADVATRGASVEETVVRDEEARRLRGVVSHLPPRLAEAIFLRYFEELSEKDVSARLGVPVGTVKSRVHTGLRKLALLLSEGDES